MPIQCCRFSHGMRKVAPENKNLIFGLNAKRIRTDRIFKGCIKLLQSELNPQIHTCIALVQSRILPDWKFALQSDLGYPATSGPAHIRISDLAGYERYA